MKTLHLTNAWHETSGGIATFYRALLAASNRRGHEIRLVVPGTTDRVEEVGEFGRIYYLQAPKASINSDYRIIFPPQYLLPASKVQKILMHEAPDIVEICDKYTLNYLGALLRVNLLPDIQQRPVIVGLSQERMDDNIRAYFGSVPFAQKLCALYMKWLYFPFFDHHITNSEYTAEELRKASQGQLVPRQTWICPMGVDLDQFSPKRRSAQLRRRLLQNFGVAEDAMLLLYAGRLVPEKNLQLLFEAARRLGQSTKRDYRLMVVGDGIEREMWEKKCAQEMPGRVMFRGHVPDKAVLADIYANSDVFVHPNPREPFGIAPLEAMASGLPLVAPNSGGVTSYANFANAWTVPADAESFTRAIEDIGNDPSAAEQKTKAALATANEYRWDAVASSFLALYERIYRVQTESSKETAAAFSSSPATGVQAALMRTVASVARGSFRLWSRLARDSRSCRPSVTGAVGPNRVCR